MDMTADQTLQESCMGALRHMGVEVTALVDKTNRLKAENAKLRELAKAAWDCVNRHVSCDECRMVCCGCTLQSAMRELGIEVPHDN